MEKRFEAIPINSDSIYHLTISTELLIDFYS